MRAPVGFRRARQRSRLFTFLAFLTLMMTLLGPLGEQLALAGNDNEAPPAEEAEIPEEEPTAIPTEEPVAEIPEETEEPEVDGGEATEVPTEAAALETYTLTINVYRCNHPEFDTGFSENLQLVIDTCTGPGYGTFNIDSTMAVPSQTGQTLTFEIGPGLHIQEVVAPGYDNPIADCFLYGPDGALVDRIGPAETSGGAWKVGSVYGDTQCNWYQVDRGLGNVYVVNMACPSTAGLFPEPSYDELVAMCTEPAGQRQFFVVHGAGLERMVPSGGEFNDAFFEAIQTGPIEIWMDDPAGFDRARVFCQVFDTDQITQITPFTEVNVGNFRATGMTLVAGQRIHCSWFNIEEGPGLAQPDENQDPIDPVEPTQTPTPQPSELRVVLHTCPPNFDPDDPGANPMAECPEGPNGVAFTLTDDQDDTPDQQSTTGDSVPNAVVFGQIPGGNYTITQSVPANVGTVFVLGCGGGGGIDPIPQEIGGTLATSIPQGVILTCHWFNIRGGGQNVQDVTDPESSPIANIADPESSPQSIAELEGTSGITITKYACPAGFDVSTVDANPTAACTPLVGISFDIDDEIDDGGGWNLETGANGTGTVTGLPAGRYTIDEGVPNGVTATFVWDCYQAGGSSNLTDPIVIGSVVQLDIPNDYQVRCDWYNVTGGTGRVIVSKHACGVLVPAYSLSYQQLREQCTDDVGSINFTVVSGTHKETQPASNNPLTLASFSNVPSGYTAVVEDLPAGWAIPIVYCQVYTENGDPVGDLMETEVRGGRQVSFELEAGLVVSCDWYNVIQGFVDVHVTKYACPEGFDAYGTGLTDLVVGCTDDPGSVEFIVEGDLYNQAKPATAAALASFTDVPSGDLRINEKMPEGYGLPVVWCRIDAETGGNLFPAQTVPVTNGAYAGYLSIYHDVSAGQVLYCDWFNVKGGTSMVSIWKQACPEGFDAFSATRQQLDQRCNEDIPDITFGLISGDFIANATSTNLFRYADFYAIPAGEVTVSEMSAEGYDTAVVWCRVQGEDGVTDNVKVEVVNGTISWDLGPDEWLICEWYNAHDTGGTVVVNKYDCPEGTTPDHDQNWFVENCTTPHDGIEFLLTHSGGLDPEFTTGGKVEWTGVPLGPVSIQERIPEEYVDPVVFCGVVSSSGGPVDAIAQPVSAEGGYVETRFDYPLTRYLCYWYNIPGGPGEIVIEKYTCPPGYDLYAQDANPEEDCGEATSGVSFQLGGPATERSDTTGGNGTVTFGDLEPGAYTITEDVPDDTASVFVLDCYGQRMGELRPYPLSTGPELEISVAAGESITCRWYNVPEEDEGRLTVIKYACTTEEYESDLDCEIEEDGVTFDLLRLNGGGGEQIDTGATDGAGRLTFDGLDEGEYWLDEQGGEFCHLESEQLSEDGDSLDVEDGEETIVHVYNCNSEPGEQGKVPTTPMKYPNTGVPPATGPSREMP